MDGEELNLGGNNAGGGDGGGGVATEEEVILEPGEGDEPGEGGGEPGEGGELDQGGDGGERREHQDEREDPETAEFKGQVSLRLRGMVKAAPELSEIFKKYPKLQGEIEATFRRDAAMRDIFATVAEARQLREKFPNGLQDVTELLADAQEIEALDAAFEKRDANGNYPGHEEIIENMVKQDKEAAVALFKTIMKGWARHDRDSYNDVISKVLGATFKQRQVESFVIELLNIAKEEDHKELKGGLEQLLGWVQGFTREKPRTQEDEDRERERQGYARERADRDKADGQRFHAQFRSAQLTLQRETINNHPAIKRMAAALAKRPEKRDKIIEDVRGKIEKFLSNSPSVMRKLKAAYLKRDLEETTKIARAAWAQPWLLNRMVRAVLAVEVPELVMQHRAAARSGGQSQARRPAPAAGGGTGKSKPTAPFKANGQWYWPDGRRMSTSDVLAGKHQPGA